MLPMHPLVAAFLIAGLTLFALILLVYGSNVLIPLAVALLFWFFINALAGMFERLASRLFRMPRFMALMLALLTILTLSMLAVNLVVTNLAAMSTHPPDFEKSLNPLISKVSELFGISDTDLLNKIMDQTGLEKLLGGILSAMAGLAGQLGVVFVYVVFLLIEQQFFDLKLNAVVKDANRQRQIRDVLERVGKDTQSYLWIMTIVSLLTALLSYVVMMAMGLQHAGFWAFLIFVLNFIPTIGSLLGTAFPALYSLLQFGDLKQFLVILIAIGAIQFVIGNVVQPKMAARTLNLSQFIVILSLFAWGAIWGVVGMFLAVPITSILMIIFSNIDSTRPLARILSQDGRIAFGEGGEEGQRA